MAAFDRTIAWDILEALGNKTKHVTGYTLEANVNSPVVLTVRSLVDIGDSKKMSEQVKQYKLIEIKEDGNI